MNLVGQHSVYLSVTNFNFTNSKGSVFQASQHLSGQAKLEKKDSILLFSTEPPDIAQGRNGVKPPNW
jgi:hypothetical protein